MTNRHERLFSSSSLSAIAVVSSVYPELLIFLPVCLTYFIQYDTPICIKTQIFKLSILRVVCVLSRSVMSDSLWPMDCSPPDSLVHGILQAGILKWVAISFSRGSSWARYWTQVFCIAGRFLIIWATFYKVKSKTLMGFKILCHLSPICPSRIKLEEFDE